MTRNWQLQVYQVAHAFGEKKSKNHGNETNKSVSNSDHLIKTSQAAAD